MRTLQRAFPWTLLVATIVACGLLATRTARRLWEAPLALTHRATHHGPRAAQPPVERGRALLERDPFRSSVAANLGELALPPPAGTLAMELVATMVGDDDRWSAAAIRDLSTAARETRLYRMGETLRGGRRVLLVRSRKVYVSRGRGPVEVLTLDDRLAIVDEGGPREREREQRPPLTPLDEAVRRGVRCRGGACEVDRGLVENLLSQGALVAGDARFFPGGGRGLRVSAVRPGSIFAAIGLENGDLLTSVNGASVAAPSDWLPLFTKLRHASNLTVAVERRGRATTLDYTIR